MKDSTIEFYVNNFVFLKSIEEADVSFLPPLIKRRLSKLDKCILSVLKRAYDINVQNIVFSSQYGEVERLIKLISQYQEEKEVSPNVFSGSVHNYPVGFFLLNEKISIPYTAISSCENSISAGLLTAIISNYDNVLYCYCDVKDDNIKAMAINICKNEKAESKKYRFSLISKPELPDNFKEYADLFNGKKSYIETPVFKIEREDNEN